jgi:predicted Zn-dependent protease
MGWLNFSKSDKLPPMDLRQPDLQYLRAAVGWLELGNAVEALAELDQLSEPLQAHPDVLETRWLALAQNQRWDAAAKVGRALIAAAPERAVGWLHHAYALRRATGGGLLAAFNALAPVADKFPKEATIPYNLACYTCQMHRDAAETLAWLQQAMTAGKRKEILARAMEDPDLEPLRAEIAKLAAKIDKKIE